MIEDVEADEVDGGFVRVVSTGMAVFVNDDGSIKWVYSVGGGFVLLLVVVFVFMMHPPLV